MEAAKSDIELTITENYLQALYYKESIIIAENNLQSSQQETIFAEKRYNAGAIAKKDYSDAISQEASNKYDLINAKNSYDAQLIKLKQLLNLSTLANFEIEEPSEVYEVEILNNLDDAYAQALENWPSIKANMLNIDISESDVDIAKSDYLPSLSLTASAGSGYTSIQDLDFFDQYELNFNQRVGLSLSIPIFNNGQTKANVAKAKIGVEKSKIQLQNSKNELFENMSLAYQNLNSAEEQLAAAESAINAAEDSYNLAKKQFDQGLINTTDVIIAQNTYTNARQNYIQAKYLRILYSRLISFYIENRT